MLKKVLILGVFGLLLGGCGQPPKPYEKSWKKQGVSSIEANRTFAECRYKVGMQKFESVDEKNQLIDDCMTMQGYIFR